MIPEDWKRIAGLEVVDDGTAACVWIAHDRQTDTIHLYDCAVFRREVLAVIAESINARGRWIPVAWEKSGKAMADRLKERGVGMTYECFESSDAIADIVARDVDERMRGGRFRAERRLAEWIDEKNKFNYEDNKVPRSAYPLMMATHIACAMHDDWARPERMPGAGKPNYPKLAIA